MISRLDRINWTTRQLEIYPPKSHADIYSNAFRAAWRLLPREAEYLATKVYYGEGEEDSFSARRKMLQLRNFHLQEFVKQETI